MNKNAIVIVSALTFTTAACLSFIKSKPVEDDIAHLRKLYSSGDYSQWPKAQLKPEAAKGFRDIGVPDKMSYPADNPASEAKKELGKLLFFDPRLSTSGQIACASCHEPQLAWGDGKQLANGHDRRFGKRNAMTILNTGFYDELFWDGRANSLEDQARFPVRDHLEMNMELGAMEKRLQAIAGYKALFQKAFGDDQINLDRVFKAIATFERTVVSKKSRFDDFVSGRPEALKDDEVLGLHLFRTKAGCVNCHNTPLFSDNKFHNDGQTLFGSSQEDLGRYNVTKNRDDVGKFRTPSLRDVAFTGPWFHHGNFPTLKDVVLFYNLGNPAPIQKKYMGVRDSLLPKTSPLLSKLNLTDKEVDALVAFMQAISSAPTRINAPREFPQ
jgi:cytochrome c peroxidase